MSLCKDICFNSTFLSKNTFQVSEMSFCFLDVFFYLFVDLSSCDLTQVPDAAYFMLKSVTVETCDLSNNLIKRIPSKFTTKFPSLTGNFQIKYTMFLPT